MKRFLTLTILIAAVLGCTEKSLEEGGELLPDGPGTVTATIEEGGMSEWLGGDKISIFAEDGENRKFLYGGQGSFAPLGDESGTWNKGSKIISVYPYSEMNELSGEGLVRMLVPEKQTYRRNAVAQHMNPMIAVSKNDNLEFRNICGYLKVKVKGNVVLTSARLTGNNGEKISGEAFVRSDIGWIPTITMSENAGTAVTMDFGKGIWAGSTGYESAALYFVVPPTTFTKGVTLELESSTGDKYKSRLPEAVTVERSRTSSLADIEFGLVNNGDPLRFISQGQSTIVLKKNGYPDEILLEYDLGEGWLPYTIGEEISLSDGESVAFQASEESNQTFSRSATDFYQFAGSGSLEARGNIMVLLNHDLEIEEIPTEYCFYGLFSGMTALTRSPDLASRTAKAHCYDKMFSGCSRLSYIKALFVTSPEDGSFTSGWVDGVNAEGTFSMSPDANWNHTGSSGIPQGWTVKNMPEDDDCYYYESIEYLSPSNTGYANSMKAEQKNKKDPSEWTFTTTGRDPYIPMSSLKRKAEGPVLVFQYKSSAPVFCEFFWCSGGYGIKGPVGGVETGFNLEATNNWKTFTMNMESEWQKFGFEGNEGDAVRFDIGTGSGVTVTTRLMRWRKATGED
ncbi:MAG: hypothetical protein ACI399_06315 [Candidatus Cryptobacteroides sp.]